MTRTSFTVIERNLKILEGQAKLEEGKTILDIIRTLDSELEKNVDNLPKKLAHFLEKRSYAKALKFIETNKKVYEKT